jgi:hypothetical protein
MFCKSVTAQENYFSTLSRLNSTACKKCNLPNVRFRPLACYLAIELARVCSYAPRAFSISINKESIHMSTQPISEARLAANRANAQHSTGATTPQGKITVSLNAVKTALTGRTVLLPTDDAAKYQALLDGFLAELQPVGFLELALVQSLVDCRWRLDRIPQLEMALLTFSQHQRPQQETNPETPIFIEMQIRGEKEKEFRNLQLQENRLARRCDKDMAELRRLQQERKAKEAEALQRATVAYLLAKHRNQSFDLAALGFEFSTQRFDAHLATLAPARQQQILEDALKGVPETQQAAA